MPTLYNCRHDGDQYRITKFDWDLNVAIGKDGPASYLCTLTECQCPAGPRPTCRHREMLPRFIQLNHIGDGWMLDYDRGGWVHMGMPEGGDGDGMGTAGDAATLTFTPTPDNTHTAAMQLEPNGTVTPVPFSRRGL